MTTDLPARWGGVAGSWGASPDRIRRAGLDLLARWGEPQRSYHTIEHLGEALDAFDRFGGPHLPDGGREAELALWFHDAVYHAGSVPGSDETASAELARAVLGGLGAPPNALAEVGRLVEFTSGHVEGHMAGDRATAVVCDADLAVLGAAPDRYRRYAAQVREEYAAVPEPDWRRGRSDVLSRLLARPRLYATEEAFTALERSARANLRWELATLGWGETQSGRLQTAEKDAGADG